MITSLSVPVMTATSGVIDEAIDAFFTPVADALSAVIFFSIPLFGTEVPLIVGWLVAAGIFFTFYLRGLSFRGMKHAIDLVRGRYDDPKAPGEVTHFQALTTALSNTLGLGNIAGVAIAITIGGPGAALWMIFAGFFAMTTKMAECMLAVKYRQINEDGSVSGGPMYYLIRGLAELGRPRLGRALAITWAICTVIAMLGLMAFQSNQAAQQVIGVAQHSSVGSLLAENQWLVGLVLALIGGAVIFGGIKAIARSASILIPVMSATYIIGCLIVILTNIDQLTTAIAAIVNGAFNPQGIAGGIVGVLIVGFQRAAFSNAAGIGDSPVAHAAVKTNEPATEGFVAALEPFFDTVCVNTLSALAIVITGVYMIPDLDGVALTSQAFATVAPWFTFVLAFAVFLFAFSAVLAYSYFGSKALGFLFGNKTWAENIFKVAVLGFVVVGASLSLDAVVEMADSLLFMMSVANILGMYFLAKVIREEFTNYWARLHAGEFARNIDAGTLNQTDEESAGHHVSLRRRKDEKVKTKVPSR